MLLIVNFRKYDEATSKMQLPWSFNHVIVKSVALRFFSYHVAPFIIIGCTVTCIY